MQKAVLIILSLFSLLFGCSSGKEITGVYAPSAVMLRNGIILPVGIINAFLDGFAFEDDEEGNFFIYSSLSGQQLFPKDGQEYKREDNKIQFSGKDGWISFEFTDTDTITVTFSSEFQHNNWLGFFEGDAAAVILKRE